MFKEIQWKRFIRLGNSNLVRISTTRVQHMYE